MTEHASVMNWGSKILIKRNVLLQGGEPILSLSDAHALKTVLHAQSAVDPRTADLASVLSCIEDVHSLYGESGLFRLLVLASTTSTDFQHFFEVIVGILVLEKLSTPDAQHELECDNERLLQGEDLRNFNSHVVMPSFSRKLYNPGRHNGYLVYGLGGPRILVSHPFRGASGELYDVYGNSVDVATSLITRGYHGSFLFLDNMPGLNREIRGVPRWLLWFSMIAAHSDLVVFTRGDEGFGRAQQREIEYTPDRVQKKIVDIPSRELKWAKQHDPDDPDAWSYFGPHGKLTREEYLDFEAEHSNPFLDHYVRALPPCDGLLRLDAESGELTRYPHDYPLYRYSAGT